MKLPMRTIYLKILILIFIILLILIIGLFWYIIRITKVKSNFADVVQIMREKKEAELMQLKEKLKESTAEEAVVPEIIIAASDSNESLKMQADYIADGINDEIEINKAINNLLEGGKIYLAAGTFHLGGSIKIVKSNIKLIGAGLATKLILDSNVNQPLIAIGDDENYYENITVMSMEINGNRLNQTSNQNGIHVFNNVRRVIIKENYVHSNFLQGIGVADNVWDIIIVNNFVEDNPGEAISVSGRNCQIIGNNAKDGWDGIVLTAGSRNCIVANNYREGGHWGILVYGNDHLINGNIIYKTGGGISIDGNWGGGKNVIITNNNLIENGYGMFLIHGSQNILITNNLIKNSKEKNIRNDFFWRRKNVIIKENLLLK